MVGLETQLYDCFISDINALKPGNVGRHGAGHGMEYADFVRSAEVVTPILCNHRLGLGARILSSVEATSAAVNCNTNLGMILLVAPVIWLFEQLEAPGELPGRDQARVEVIGTAGRAGHICGYPPGRTPAALARWTNMT